MMTTRYAVRLRNPKTGETRRVVVKLERHQEANARWENARRGKPGLFPPVVNSYACQQAARLVPPEFDPWLHPIEVLPIEALTLTLMDTRG